MANILWLDNIVFGIKTKERIDFVIRDDIQFGLKDDGTIVWRKSNKPFSGGEPAFTQVIELAPISVTIDLNTLLINTQQLP